jgi:hypothetical protein
MGLTLKEEHLLPLAFFFMVHCLEEIGGTNDQMSIDRQYINMFD